MKRSFSPAPAASFEADRNSGEVPWRPFMVSTATWTDASVALRAARSSLFHSLRSDAMWAVL